MDPRTPVVVGVGQVSLREGPKPSPLALTADAVRLAEADAGAPLLARAGAVAVVDPFSWSMPDPGRALADELGITPAATLASARGGTGPVLLLGALAQRIADGDLDVGVVAGGEVVTEFMAALQAGRDPGWPRQAPDTPPAPLVGEDREPHHPAEQAAGLIAPIFFYPLFEQAVRGAAGRGVAEHQQHLGRLWSRFAAVARDNPHAWSPNGGGVEDPAQAGPGNRMVSFPYPKLLNANIQVDQAAALIVCSAEAARAAGVPRDRWVFVHATATAHDHWFAVEREALHRSPAIAATTGAALSHAGLGIDDVGLLDLYSCFPSAVQIAAGELGIDPVADAREPTVTGGLTFAGGPANNYVTHSLATMAGRLREQDGDGLCTAVGWYLTKHGAALLSSREPERPFADLHPQDEVDALPSREALTDHRGALEVEAYTALFDRDGTPTLGVVSGLVGGSRVLARSEDRDVIAALLDGDALGRPVQVDGPTLLAA